MKNSYNSLTLSTQLQVTFAFAVLVLSAIIVLINSLQLDWLKSEITSLSESSLHEQVLKGLQLQGSSQSNYIENEIKGYIKFVTNCKNFVKLAFSQIPDVQQPFANSNPFWVSYADAGSVYYGTSLYSSRFGIPIYNSPAYQIVLNASRLNWIFPGLYRSEFLNIFQGFNESEIIQTYPAMYFSTWNTYTPIVREWYHFALINPNLADITEPYHDAITGEWIISISQVMKNNDGSVLGVAGVDIKISTLTSYFQNNYSDLGFKLLVTQAGLIIFKPATWKIDEGVRIFEEKSTGISQDLWDQIQVAENGKEFMYSDINGTAYVMCVYLIRPYDNSNATSHYLMLFAEDTSINLPSEHLKKNFYDIKVALFWTVLAFQLVVILVALLLIYFFSVKANRKLSAVSRTLSKIRRRSLYQNSVKTVDLESLRLEQEGIEELTRAVEGKIKRIEQEEYKFSYFSWQNTRPSDESLYSKWTNYIFPISKFSEKKVRWRKTLRKLSKLSDEEDFK